MAAKAQAIKIDPEGRYAVVLKTRYRLDATNLARVQSQLASWWASGAKFLVLDLVPGEEARFERLDAEPQAEAAP